MNAAPSSAAHVQRSREQLMQQPIYYRLAVRVYRTLRGWRWWRIKFRAWRTGSTLRVDVGSYILSPTVDVALAPGAVLIIGKDVCLRRYTTIDVRERVEIGDNTLIAEMVTIRDHNHNIMPGQLYRAAGFVSAPIIIEQNVWIANKVTVTAGVRIGANTVVGANAVVAKDLPGGVIAAGVPARVLRNINES